MILIDTSPLVSLCDSRDSLHTAAIKHLGSLASAGLGTCEAVLMECCFHLEHREQRRRLRALLEALAISSLAGPCDGNFWSSVFEWLDKYAEHEPNWADAYIAVLCGHNKRLKVWTYDSKFRTTWRRPDGSAIPMAIRT